MQRLLFALAAAFLASAAQAGDRYGPDRPALREAKLPTSTRLLAWSGARLPAPSPVAVPKAASLRSLTPAASPAAAVEPAAPPALRAGVRRYSVGREFGVAPDPIVLPRPSVLAYAPEVGEAVLAQQERDRAATAVSAGPLSPADQDLQEQERRQAEWEANRERAQERARLGG